MADSNIGSLPGAASLDGDALFVAEQQGQAVKISGEQILRVANVETAEQVAQAAASANAAQESAAAAQTAIVKAPMIQNKTWWIWNQSAGEYQDTGISAVGPQGIPGPTASVNGVAPDEDGDIVLSAGDVGAYSKAESDTALAARAPGGFGLGTYVADAPPNAAGNADANLITKTGFYRAIANVLLGGGWHYVLHMEYLYSTHAVQISLFASGGAEGIRKKINGVWGPWEYINPLLNAGIEYRTIERYLGKPVYVKLVDCGAMPGANTSKSVAHNISNIAHIVCFGGEMKGIEVKAIGLPYRFAENNLAYISADNSKILIISGATALTLYTNTYVWLKYTKTTD